MFIFLLLIFFQLSAQMPANNDLPESLKMNLAQLYHLDEYDSSLILKKLQPYSDMLSPSLLNEFFKLSKDLQASPQSLQISKKLHQEDAVIKAPKWHQILFENDSLRILESIVHPGETVPFHTHQWDSIVLTIQGSRFETIDSMGTKVTEDWLPMVEKLDGSLEAYSYSNVGSQTFYALVFEVKN